MVISKEMESIIQKMQQLEGYVCHGLVNYQLGVSALNETSSIQDESNFFQQQGTAIIKTLISSLGNLNGGYPSKLMVEAENMTMIISIVNDTYFCGLGLKPGTDPAIAGSVLADMKDAIKLQF